MNATAPSAPTLNLVGATLFPVLNISTTLPNAGLMTSVSFYYGTTPGFDSTWKQLAVVNAPGGFFTPGQTVSYSSVNDITASGNYYFVAWVSNDIGPDSNRSIISSITINTNSQTYPLRYLAIRYGLDQSGAGFSPNPVGNSYLGIYNSASPDSPASPAAYTWFSLGFVLSASMRLYFRNQGNRTVSWAVGANPDQTVWSDFSAPPNPLNPQLDLDSRTGYIVTSITSGSAGSGNGGLNVSTPDPTTGQVTITMPNTNRLGSFTLAGGSMITVDDQGRWVAINSPDLLYQSAMVFTATAGQTAFAYPHMVGQSLVWRNGVLLDTSEYSETASGYTLNSGCNANDLVWIMKFTLSNSGGTAFAPFTRTTVPSVASQASYSITFNQNYELLFFNGAFITDGEYDYNGTNNITFKVPPAVSGALITVISFRGLNMGSGLIPYVQAVGGTTAGQQSVTLTGGANTSYSLATLNGSTLVPAEYSIGTTNTMNLTTAPYYSGMIVETTSFLATGPAALAGLAAASSTPVDFNSLEYKLNAFITGVPTLISPGSPDPAGTGDFPRYAPFPTLGELLQLMKQELDTLNQEITTLKGQ